MIKKKQHLPPPKADWIVTGLSFLKTAQPTIRLLENIRGRNFGRKNLTSILFALRGNAIVKQDLYINASLAQMGCSLLWSMFRNGFIQHRGFFLNLKEWRMQPICID
jgi:hypothetical protein